MTEHETTLRAEAKRFGRLAEQFIWSAPREGQARRAERDAAVEALRAAEKLLIRVVEERRLAGADALRRGTCGTCYHVKVSPPMCGLPALYMCGNKDAPAHAASSVDPDDGCIQGYAPTEPTR